MNKLEKEINYEIGKNYGGQHVASMCHQMATDGKKNGFRDGADFVLSKNLPVLFAEWLSENEHELFELFGTISYTTQEAYEIWINNIYGK